MTSLYVKPNTCIIKVFTQVLVTMTCARVLQVCQRGMIEIPRTELRTKCGSEGITAPVCLQLCTEDVNHAFSTGLRGPGTRHGFGVYRANLKKKISQFK